MKNRRWLSSVGAVIVALGGVTAQAGTDQPPSSDLRVAQADGSMGTGASASAKDLSSGDKKFMQKAAKGGAMEVALGRIAAKQATAPPVKEFGQRMVDDHSKANAELKQLADRKGVTLTESAKDASGNPPATSAAEGESMYLDSSDRKMIEKFTAYSGAKFDREYMDHMVDDHEKDVGEFEDASKNAKDPDVKAFAAKTLPTLQEHLRMAKDTQKLAKDEAKNEAKNSSTSSNSGASLTSPTTTGREPTGVGTTGPRDSMSGSGTGTTPGHDAGTGGALMRPPPSDSAPVGSGQGSPAGQPSSGSAAPGSTGTDSGTTR